ncbi:uncharacterized protein LOC111066646 [Drosophila obscura]|uniref:uncharacterized protein LOC111066646 n=1 Tax=Drosophila obscura TaxID=7282 RepID=UPI001BB2563D|nr:uncharacterized protein LOC111066646 [Drosophila obscura]
MLVCFKCYFQSKAGKMRSQLMLCALVGFFLILKVNVNDAITFRLTNFVCESYNKSYAVFNTCRLKAVNRKKVLLNMNVTLLYPTNNIGIHCRLFKKANGYRPWTVDRKLDLCRYMRTRYDPYFKIVYGLFQDFSNINHTCPYVGHQILKDLYLRPELLGLLLPTGDYLLSLQWMFDKNAVDTNVSFSFVEDLLLSK